MRGGHQKSVSIKISPQKFVGCGACAEVCPGSLIRLDDGLAKIQRPERCWGCVSCVKECPVQAISFYLSEDMGGSGGAITVKREGSLLHWVISKPDGETQTITVDSRDSNKY
jgi:adenylylsulfate reductase subunit B